MSANKIFDLIPVIDLLENDASENANLNISCIEGCGNNIFIGTISGAILSFSIKENQIDGGKMSATAEIWAQQSLQNVGKNKSSIVKMSSVSALNTLLVLSSGFLFYLQLQDLVTFGTSTINSIVCFALNVNPRTENPFTLQLALGIHKKALLLCEKQSGVDRLKTIRKLTVDDPVLTIEYDGDCVCFATCKNYFVYDFATDTHQLLFPIDAEIVRPFVERIGTMEFIVNGMQNLGVFATGAVGVSTRPPVLWGVDDVHSVAYFYPNLLALTDQFIVIYSILDQQPKQRIPFFEGRSICNSDGQLFVTTKKEVYKLEPVSWHRQVESLLQEGLIADALSVADVAINRIDYDELQLAMFGRLRQKAAFLLFEQGETEKALDLMIESELDPRELISLYPGLLPQHGVFTRSIPALHQLASIHSQFSGENADDFLVRFLNHTRYLPWTTPYRNEMNTALIKLSARTRDLESFERICTDSNAVFDADDCLEWLEQFQFHHCQALLLQLKLHKTADSFWMWRKMVENEINDDQFPGVHDSIGRLTSVSDEEDIITNALWMIIYDPELTINTILECRVLKDVRRMALALDEYPLPLFAYLHGLIIDQKCEIAPLHTRFALLFIELINHTINSCPFNEKNLFDLHHRFRQFLSRSIYYNIDQILAKIENSTNFLVEKAFILGRSGSLDEALRILVYELEDFDGAAEFCSEMAVNLHRTDRHNLYESLLSAYLTNSSTSMSRVVDLLNNHSDLDVDLCKVLQILPSDWSFSSIAPFMLRSVHRQLTNSTNIQLKQILTRSFLNRLEYDKSVQSSLSFAINERTRCAVCRDLFVDSDGYRYPTGALVHMHCLGNPRLCPLTKIVIL